MVERKKSIDTSCVTTILINSEKKIDSFNGNRLDSRLDSQKDMVICIHMSIR